MNTILKHILLLLIFTGILAAQHESVIQGSFPNPILENLSIGDGLPNNTVSAITQDRFGYLWLGTLNGLVKYDGYTIKTYTPVKNDSLSINNRWISKIFEDHKGSLWIGTTTGLNLFNRKTENFTRYLSSISVLDMCEDAFGNFWVAVDKGLFLFDRESNTFQLYNFRDSSHINEAFPAEVNDNEFVEMSSANITSLAADTLNRLLFLGTASGLYSLNPGSHVVKKILSDFELENISTLYRQTNGTIWIGFDKGFASFNPKKSQITFYQNINLPVTAIAEDDDGYLWCYAGSQTWAATGNEIIVINPSTNQYQRRSSEQIWSMYKDHSGIFWFGTRFEGLNKWNKNKWKFDTYKHLPDNKNTLSSDFVWSVYVDPEGIIWIGTQNGLDRFDRESGTFKNYSINNNEVTAIHGDDSGILWLGTRTQGLVRFNPLNETFRIFSHNPKDETSIGGNHVFSILTDSHGLMWVVTRYNGLNLFNKTTGTFTRYRNNPNDPGSLSQNDIFFIYEDGNNNLWICAEYLNRYDRVSGKFTSVELIKNTLPTSVFEDSKGNFWVGTYFNGLLLVDKEKLVVLKNYTEKEGLPYNTITNIVEDNNGNLWIKTFNGFSRFNPDTETFRNYYTSDGLPEIMTRLVYTYESSANEVFFGSSEGFYCFYPDSIKDDPTPPKVVISNISLFNKPDETLSYDGFISEIEKIDLPYNHNDLRFDFVGLHYGEPAKNRYKYMLENFDADWVDAGTQRNATYTNLSPGVYIFRVIACNRDGVWNEEGAFLNLIISPPFWATWWAYSLYVIFFGLVLYGVRRYEMNRVNLKNQVKLDEVKLKEKEETDKMKSRFFANISHEFRTPLTLILGPTEKIISSTKEEETQKQTGLIKRNAARLLNLVNQLLDLSKLEAGKLQLQASKGNIVTFVKGLTMSFESLAERKDVKLKVIAEMNDIELYFDRDKMAKILANLLSNAFKFTGEGGEITVALTLIPSNSGKGMSNLSAVALAKAEGQGERKVVISVKDTGIGISEEELPKLFDRFYQVDSSQTREHEGTGIGLALTKELVELHHGKIRVASQVGKGSEFIVELPVGKEHLRQDEIVDRHETDTNVILNNLPAGEAGAKNLTHIVEDSVSHFDPAGAGQAKLSVTVENHEDKTLILVVEDNADVREYIKDSLGSSFTIEMASNGEQGVKKATEIIPDLIISDIMMPKMDGNELTRRIKNDERTSHIPVILLTAKSEQESKLEGLETGADDYLTKPFDTKELLIRIKNLITIRRKLQEKFSGEKIISRQVEKKLSHLDEKFLSKVLEVAEKHLSEEEFSIEDFGNEVGMGRVQLHRKLKALTGKSPSLYLRSVRLAKAKKMIEEKQGNISEIAYSVGFSTPIYFTKCFKEEFGYTPSNIMH
jgi:signal transduction histidine kinase/ligand-binding sensor domain-containing protein/DNA-binding response OmpR family regulator